jgi:hypothetical protein
MATAMQICIAGLPVLVVGQATYRLSAKEVATVKKTFASSAR